MTEDRRSRFTVFDGGKKPGVETNITNAIKPDFKVIDGEKKDVTDFENIEISAEEERLMEFLIKGHITCKVCLEKLKKPLTKEDRSQGDFENRKKIVETIKKEINQIFDGFFSEITDEMREDFFNLLDPYLEILVYKNVEGNGDFAMGDLYERKQSEFLTNVQVVKEFIGDVVKDYLEDHSIPFEKYEKYWYGLNN